MPTQDAAASRGRPQEEAGYSVGELAELTGLTPGAIRLYDGAGLVCAARDRMNRRRFTATDLRHLRLVPRLRSVGLGLDRIGRILTGPLPQARAAEALRRRILELQDQLAAACAALRKIEGQGAVTDAQDPVR